MSQISDLLATFNAYPHFVSTLNFCLSAKGATQADITDIVMTANDNSANNGTAVHFTFRRGDTYDAFSLDLVANAVASAEVDSTVSMAGDPVIDETQIPAQ